VIDKVSYILKKNLGKTVVIMLKNRRRIRGKLEGFDKHLNLLLRYTEEISDTADVKKLGSMVVRGENLVIIYLSSNQEYDNCFSRR